MATIYEVREYNDQGNVVRIRAVSNARGPAQAIKHVTSTPFPRFIAEPINADRMAELILKHGVVEVEQAKDEEAGQAPKEVLRARAPEHQGSSARA